MVMDQGALYILTAVLNLAQQCELMLSLLPSGDKWPQNCVTWT